MNPDISVVCFSGSTDGFGLLTLTTFGDLIEEGPAEDPSAAVSVDWERLLLSDKEIQEKYINE